MTTDKTGADAFVMHEAGRFTICVEGRPVGFTQFADRDGQRVFFHTEVDDKYEGRGLATILVGKALASTKDAGLRIVPVCELVAGYIERHPEFNAATDPPTADVKDWVRSAS
jgi:predicted GNAT family acetyltransferase